MIEDYLLATDSLDPPSLLAEWRWLIGDRPFALRAVAAVGNLFLEDRSGGIFFLEIEDGTFERIAESGQHFEEMLGDRHHRRAWLQTFLVRELRRGGMTLGPGECYAMKIPFLLGGASDDATLLDAYEPMDVTAHVSILGQLHRQARDLAPGSPIDEIRIELPPGS